MSISAVYDKDRGWGIWVIVTGDKREFGISEAQRNAFINAANGGARFISIGVVDINPAFVQRIEWKKDELKNSPSYVANDFELKQIEEANG